jgi:hypothetical protein
MAYGQAAHFPMMKKTRFRETPPLAEKIFGHGILMNSNGTLISVV